MNNIFINEDQVKEFNNWLYNSTSQNEDVNFINLLIAKTQNKITFNFKLYNESSNYIDTKGNNIEFSEFYYGLSPEFDNELIINLIIERKFKENFDVDQFIENNYKYFMMYEKDKRIIKYIYKYVALSSISRFGIICELNNGSTYKEFVEKYRRFENAHVKFLEKDCKIILLGSIPDILKSELENDGYVLREDNEKLLLLKNRESNGDLSILDNQLTIKKHITLAYGDTFYSGILPRLMEIKKTNNYFSNESIDAYDLLISRTTFFTSSAFDNCFYNQSIFLTDNEKKIINEFFFDEDAKQKEVILNLQEKNDLSVINDYLVKSSFTNIIGVSSNITTIDDHYIICRRSEKAIDNDTLYPSSNGQCEIYDHKVSFYSKSVNEDKPTIYFEDIINSNIIKEMERETNAELGLYDFLANWEYLGLSVLGINQSESNSNVTKRRFHFNILGENTVSNTFISANERFENAIEKYENKKIYFINTAIYKNIIHYFFINIKKMLEIFNESKVFVDAIFFIYAAIFLGVVASNWIYTLIPALLAIIRIIQGLSITLRKRLIRRKVNYVKNKIISKNYRDILSITLKKINRIDKRNTKYHAISLMMYGIYIVGKVNNNK